ncbi:MAG: hemerythrin domain-containing protein [Burkholderiales bacterium]|nr:MAG: hemerythrin domain-containing protein [Burkholderiales bacterium]
MEAFREDHAVLGAGFSRLSQRLRAQDIAGAIEVARRLDAEAGAHVAFEERHFYPALASLLGEAEVERMYAEHADGFDVVRTLIELAPGESPAAEARARMLARSQAMEVHIAECGELFEAMGRIPAAEQAQLYAHLLALRRRAPRWAEVVGQRDSR